MYDIFLSCLFFSIPFSFFRFLVFSLLSLPSPFLFFGSLASAVRMRSDKYYVQFIRGSLPWVASGMIGFSRRE